MDEQDWASLERAATANLSAPPNPGLGTLWFSMRGRIPRSTYWLKFALPLFAIQMAGGIGDALAGTVSPSGIGPMSLVTWIAVIYPGLVGAVKRLHDLDYPGWYLAVIYGGMVGSGVAMAIAVPMFGDGALLLLLPTVVLFVASIWFSVKMCFFRGTPGPNQFGPDPLRKGQTFAEL